jgi:hypothetical protein
MSQKMQARIDKHTPLGGEYRIVFRSDTTLVHARSLFFGLFG